jgi:glycosyltransferase involved in cell wall biosynthesis
MKIFMIHDPYSSIKEGSVAGEDNLAELQIKVLIELGHDVFDSRVVDFGLKHKKNQLIAQATGASVDIIKNINRFKPDVIHTLNLSQRTGYGWMRKTVIPIASSIHNFRLFCPSSIAWRDGKVCTKCLDSSAINAIKYGCAGKIGALNSVRHLVFQRDYPQVNIPKMFLLASEKMRNVFSRIIPESKLAILPTPSSTTNVRISSESKRSGWLFSGRLTQEKGIIELINSWPDDENLHIAGNGPLKEVVANLIRDKKNVKLVGTYSPGDHSIFLKYEGLIFPSTWLEGSPLVVMECLGTGTPVICTSFSSASEQVRGVNGGVVIYGDLTKLNIIEAMQKIRMNFDFFSSNARSRTKDKYSIGSWGLSFERLLTKTIEPGSI